MTANTFSPHLNQGSGKLLPALKPGSRIVVVGAGAFGGWAAFFLLKQGYHVTLVDAWGPGNSRSSSGDETRVIRSTYGANAFYFDLNVRALELWKHFEKQWQVKLFQNKGVLWFCYNSQTPLVDDSIPFAQQHGMMYQRLSPAELKARYPLIRNDDLSHAYFDSFGGCLRAREACQAVHKAFVREGGSYVQGYAKPGKSTRGHVEEIELSTGSTLQADVFVFACGAWLGQLFPEVLGHYITCTKQEVYYFGVPDAAANALDHLPVWVDVDGQDYYYGIPGNNYRGFKIGVDRRGEPFNPTTGERQVTPHVLEKARAFIAHRFPVLKDAPLVESRVCPYENSPDGNFLFDQHPEYPNVFFLGGGSGHGFKHGPSLGELVSEVFAGNKRIPELFLLNHQQGVTQ